MKFVKRDLILVAGSVFFIVGLLPFMSLAYSMMVGIGIFFGIKIFVAKRKATLDKEIGEGFCANCGDKIINKKCPTCDAPDQ